jgi:hypothetical protein
LGLGGSRVVELSAQAAVLPRHWVFRHQFPQIAATLPVLARYWTTTQSACGWRY